MSTLSHFFPERKILDTRLGLSIYGPSQENCDREKQSPNYEFNHQWPGRHWLRPGTKRIHHQKNAKKSQKKHKQISKIQKYAAPLIH